MPPHGDLRWLPVVHRDSPSLLATLALASLTLMIFSGAGCPQQQYNAEGMPIEVDTGDTIVSADHVEHKEAVIVTAVVRDQSSSRGASKLQSRAQNPDGSLAKLTSVATVDHARGVQLHDLTGDDTAEAIVHGSEGELGYHTFDSGTLQWSPLIEIAAPTSQQFVRTMVVSDADGDGDDDIVLAAAINQFPSNFKCELRAYINDGKGSFAPKGKTAEPVVTVFSQTTPPFDTQDYLITDFDDFDADGDDDLLLAGTSGRVGNFDDRALILECDGKGGYNNWTSINSHSTIDAIACGDANSDDFTDIAIFGPSASFQPEACLWIAFDSADFDDDPQLVIALEGSNDVKKVYFQDLDGLHGDDLLICRSSRVDYLVSNAAGKKDPLLEGPFTAYGGSNLCEAMAFDQDKDGAADTIVTFDENEPLAQSFVCLNEPGQPFRIAGEQRIPAILPSLQVNASCQLVDIDGDGDEDVFNIGTGSSGSVIDVYENVTGKDGQYDILYMNSVSFSDDVLAMKVKSAESAPEMFDRVSLAVLTNSKVYVRFRHGDMPQAIFDMGFFSRGKVAVEDMNGDGLDDIVVQGNSTSLIEVLINNNDGTFTPVAKMPKSLPGSSGTRLSLSVGDVNGDGAHDIAYHWGNSNQAHVLLNDGTGQSFALLDPFTSVETFQIVQCVKLADVNGDNLADLITTHYNSINSTPATPEIYVRLASNGNPLAGEGLFEEPLRISAAPGPSPIAVGDVDGDADLDLVIGCMDSSFGKPRGLRVYHNDGRGNFTAPDPHPLLRTGGQPNDVTIGQLDAFNGPELIAASIHGGVPDAFQGISIHTSAQGEKKPALKGDLNGDGQVNVDDLVLLLGSWGPCPQNGACSADLAPPNGDGQVNVDDLVVLLGNWG